MSRSQLNLLLAGKTIEAEELKKVINSTSQEELWNSDYYQK